MSEPTFKEIWETLSKIDVSEHIKKVNNCDYLSWSWAWGVLMDNYPQAEYEFGDPVFYPGDTVEVNCKVQIGPCTRQMWLPVMTGYKHASHVSPDSRAIGDAKMRCLVKCLAMFGLGHYIYAGEDLPRDEKPAKKPTKKIPAKKAKQEEPITEELIALLRTEAETFPVFSSLDLFESWVEHAKNCGVGDLTLDSGEALLKYLKENKNSASWTPKLKTALRLAAEECAT